MWPTGMAHPPLAGIRIAVIRAVALGAAEEPNQRVRPTGEATAATVARPSLLAQLPDPLEQRRVDWRLERGRLFFLIGVALVADRAAGIQRVRQDLGEPGLGEAQLVRPGSCRSRCRTHTG